MREFFYQSGSLSGGSIYIPNHQLIFGVGIQMNHITPIIGKEIEIYFSIREGVKIGVDYKLMRARFLRGDLYRYSSVGLFIVALLVG